MKRVLLVGLLVVTTVALGLLLLNTSDSPTSPSLGAAETPQTPPRGAPIFELDPSWPHSAGPVGIGSSIQHWGRWSGSSPGFASPS